MSNAEQQLRDRLREVAPQPRQLDFDALAHRVSRRRRSRTVGGVGLVAALTVVAVIVPVALVSGSSPRPTIVSGQKVIRGAPLTSTIIIDPSGAETFAPPPSYLHATVTAEQAFDAFARRQEPIPARLSYQLGILTSPPAITDVLVWGFHGRPGACVGGSAPGLSAPSPPQRCIEWDFVSATTGRGVDSTWQTIGLPAPAPSLAPGSPVALQSGGFLDTEQQRYSPQSLVLQGPVSAIRWSFENSTCTIALHWFVPPATQSSPPRAACPWTHNFTTSLTNDFTSRGHVFTVIAGYVPGREHYSVKATLADGDTQTYDAADADGAWLFAVQRCGNITGTAIRGVTLLKYVRGVPHAVSHAQRIPQTNLATIQQNCQSH